VVTVVVAITRFVTYLSNRSERVEDFLEGQPCCVIDEGRLNLKALDGERFSREELFMLLREKGVRQLGQVQRAYLEPSGAVSVFRAPDESCKPGLPVIPPYDEWTPQNGLAVSGAARQAGITYACWKCGHTEKVSTVASPCDHCGNDAWVEATRDPLV
ncbi:MAG TPA: YetF domain-containing protein, partial [Hyphomonadaceae bacterium]|nr:YetF domain-containing protein [Hyphomonadaceae bacterium]